MGEGRSRRTEDHRLPISDRCSPRNHLSRDDQRADPSISRHVAQLTSGPGSPLVKGWRRKRRSGEGGGEVGGKSVEGGAERVDVGGEGGKILRRAGSRMLEGLRGSGGSSGHSTRMKRERKGEIVLEEPPSKSAQPVVETQTEPQLLMRGRKCSGIATGRK